MSRDLFAEDREVEEQDLQRSYDLIERIADIERELELYSHPAWRYFSARLRKIEETAKEELIYGEPDRVAPARERIKLARDLAKVEEQLRDELAETRAELKAPQDEEE